MSDETTPAPSLFVSPGSIAWPRLLLAMGGAITAGVAMALLDPDSALVWTEVGLLGLATLLMPFARVDAHVFVRASLWGVLAFGGMATVFEGHAPHNAVLGGAAIALLALGRAGLDGERGGFAPKVLRRSLLTMMVVGLCVTHIYALFALQLELTRHEWVTASMLETPAHFFTHASALLSPVLLLAGVLGLSRTKAWGLFAYLGAIAVSGLIAALAFFNGYPGFGEIPGSLFLVGLWGLGAILLTLVALPVAGALVFRQVPSKREGKPWGQYVHAGLVLAAVLGAFYLRAQLF